MIHSVDLDRDDFKRLSELKEALGSKNKSEIFRYCLREIHRRYFPGLLTLDSEFSGEPPALAPVAPRVPAEPRNGEPEPDNSADPAEGRNSEIFDLVRNALDPAGYEAAEKVREMELRAAADAARAKSHFFSTMSHEIRTPLNAVIGFTELLRGGDISPGEQREYLEAINISGNALLSLIDDALDLIKLEAGQLEITPLPTDLASLLEDTRAFFAAKAREKKLHLEVRGVEGLPEFYLDAARMRQILLKLVGNAVKYTMHGTVTLTVSFARRRQDSGTLVISVADTGIGIPDAFRKQLFQPLSRQYPVHNGPGLGLTMVNRLLARMGGELECRSVENEGSVFTVKLENIRCATAPDEEKLNPRKVLSPLAQSLRVLLVDDVPTNLNLLEAMLKRLGQQPVCASSAQRAFELFAGGGFELVMTDLWMPEINGAELASMIRGSGKPATLVAVTADVEYGNNFDMGLFDAVLTKPVTPDKIRRLLEDILRRRNA
ncbi:MAG: ATP-binding protein [Victivallaceae bacterium]